MIVRTHRLSFVFRIPFLLLALGSCLESTETSVALPTPSTIITVKLHEYSFQVQGNLSSGRVVLYLVNAGQERHAPMLVPLEASSPPIEEEVRDGRTGAPLASVNPRLPAHTGTFAVDLEPGKRYALICRLRGQDGVLHAQKGMVWESKAVSKRDA